MGISLKDQLLKAGLVTKKQAQKVDASKRKQEHDSKKNQVLAKQLQDEKQQELSAIEEEKRKRHELDKELNKKRDQLILQRENYYRAIQLINSQCLNSQSAQECYFFQEQNWVRKVYVTPWQREMLARGKYGIARRLDDLDEFFLIPRSTAELLMQIYPDKLLVLHSIVDDGEELSFF